MVFLAGPPGSCKSALGRQVSAELGLRFIDLDDDGSTEASLQQLVRARGADVVTLPWAPARDARWFEFCRRSGETVGLWSHPLEMQARSGHAESLFTPVKRLRTHGGFGRLGTGCREYRHLERACEHVLLFVDVSVEGAVQDLKELVADLRSSEELSPSEREGLLQRSCRPRSERGFSNGVTTGATTSTQMPGRVESSSMRWLASRCT